MVETLTEALEITADWESLAEGMPEERACFAELSIRCHGICLTVGHDSFVNRTRQAPYLSAYHLAEWLAWNWWRLRWEPRPPSSPPSDWAFAHCLANIGEGYVWPNITIFSDGERTALIAKPNQERPETPFRYISDQAAVVPAKHFEAEVDAFINQVQGQLRAEGLQETNLDRIWQDVWSERRDQDMTLRRKFEALLGHDPDEADQSVVERLIQDADVMGRAAMTEIAAGHAPDGGVMTAVHLEEAARTRGFDSSPGNAVRLATGFAGLRSDQAPAWRVGAEMARWLRQQERLGDSLITNDILAGMAGVDSRILDRQADSLPLSFALDARGSSRVVLRSKWATGRRFELARLLGDRLATQPATSLFPATRAYTFRQKVQRAFAAEFLSPFEAVKEMLAGDYSTEALQDAAQNFDVSDLTIRTLLVNHRLIECEELDDEAA